MGFTSINKMMNDAASANMDLFELIINDDMSERAVSREESFEKMTTLWNAMKDSVKNYDGSLRSNSGLSGGDGKKYNEYRQSGNTLSGEFISEIIEKSISVSESNACMKRIVAAPTAGSCGVIPAVLTTYYKTYAPDESKIIQSLFIAAAVGEVIAYRASIAGAECGCQAEIGAASSMAAAALTYLMGGTSEMIMNAGAIALKNLLGLTCDPVGGYVEVPCVKRNVIGSVNAVTSADITMAGIKSVIPFDEVIDAMGEIGRKMDISLRETAKGGLAATPTGLKYAPNQS